MNSNGLKADFKILANDLKKVNFPLLALALSIVGFSCITISPAQAQVTDGGNGNEDYIEELKTKTEGIDDVGNNVYLVAAGSTAFAGGSKIAKRVLYA